LSLPVGNKRPIRLELISVMSAPEQWSGQKNIVRSHNEQIAAAINTLSQMKLAQGSMSVMGLDILHRKVPFRQSDLDSSPLDWKRLAEALRTIDNDTVSAALLQAKGSAPFFREVMGGQLMPSAGAPRVFIVISSSLLFGQGSDRKPLELQGDCGCRVYHLRFRHTVNDVFDDLERLLKPLRPKTFNLVAPRDLRKAVAEIIKDIENL
jgi:hypothetical protein